VNGELEIGTVEMQDDGRNVIVAIELRNNTDRTLHAYADPQNIHYDPAPRKLTVGMTDREATEPMPSIRRPNLRTVDPKGVTVLRLTLPRIVNRMAQSAEKQTSSQFEKLNIFEAKTVEVQIAWSDRPFYIDPRPRKAQLTPRQELLAWEKGLAIGRGGRKR
jgi:hypothetical protein